MGRKEIYVLLFPAADWTADCRIGDSTGLDWSVEVCLYGKLALVGLIAWIAWDESEGYFWERE